VVVALFVEMFVIQEKCVLKVLKISLEERDMNNGEKMGKMTIRQMEKNK